MNATANSSDPIQILGLQVSVVFQVLPFLSSLNSLPYCSVFYTSIMFHSSDFITFIGCDGIG